MHGSLAAAPRCVHTGLLAFGLAFAPGAEPASAQAPPPHIEWRTLETEHFRITFPAGMDELAQRAGAYAEEARSRLGETFLPAPEGTVDILLTDHTDYSNGFAQYVPSNRITIYARPPVDLPTLGYYDDWLRLVIVHELAHVFHIDRTANPVGKAARAVFGRVGAAWPFFPGSGLPRWGIEGIATWYESALTGAGRVHGTFHNTVLRTAVIEGAFEGLGQAQGDSPVWPGGQRPYVYGSQFFEYMHDRYGDEGLAAFAQAVAGQWVPFRLNAAAKHGFGITLSQAWHDWEESVRADAEEFEGRARELGPLSVPEPVTRGARRALYPVFSADGLELYYALADGRSDPAVARMRPEGVSGEGPPGGERLFRVNDTGPVAPMPSGHLLFAQQDFEGAYSFYGDLYLASIPSGRTRRLTEGARLSQPSATPAGRAVAIREGAGTRSLVHVDLETGAVRELVPASPDEHWAYPAVSPDGRWIAATRWRAGARSDIVILDSEGREAAAVTADRALDLAPRWSADGRHLVWMSDRTGTFNVLGVEWDAAGERTGESKLLTNLLTAAGYPALDPAGEWLYFSAYHADGWEIERTPFDFSAAPAVPVAMSPPHESERDGSPARSVAAGAADPDEREASGPGAGGVQAESRPYSSLSTLAPTYWEPQTRSPVVTSAVSTPTAEVPRRELLGRAFGLTTSGRDLVGRHSYSLSARVFIPDGNLEAGLAYSFHGLGNPALGLSVSQSWDDDGARLAGGRDGAEPDILYVLERERRAAVSATFVRRRARSYAAVSLDAGVARDDFTLLDSELEPATRYRLTRPRTDLFDYSASFFFSSVRSTEFHMGPHKGASFYVRARDRRELSLPDTLAGSGLDRSAQDLLSRFVLHAPLFRAGYGQHAVAARVSAAAARGPGAHGGYFDVGGASGSPENLSGLGLFGGSSIFLPVRGYQAGERGGDRAWSVSFEYRFPLALVNRGLGPWPAHLDRFFGSVFFDAGDAWAGSSAAGSRPDPMASAGVEATADLLTFFRFPLRVRGGVAFPLDDARPVWYVRLGLPF